MVDEVSNAEGGEAEEDDKEGEQIGGRIAELPWEAK